MDQPRPTDAGTEIDPVCGMSVDPATAKGGSAEHAGRTYYFCSTGCRERFTNEPARYLDPDRFRLPQIASEARPGHVHAQSASHLPPAGAASAKVKPGSWMPVMLIFRCGATTHKPWLLV